MKYVVFLLSLLAPSIAAQEFESASGVVETRERIQGLVKDEIWWAMEGDAMRWNFKNLHRFMPTVNVYREGAVRPLQSVPSAQLASYPVDTPAGKMGFKEFLDSEHSATMGVVILHRGQVVFEHYPQMQPYEKPIYWSVSKVLVSSLVAIFEARGEIDINKPIDAYIPELKESAYAGVLVSNILDMASGVDCPDGDYYDRTTCYSQYAVTLGDSYWTEDSPDNPYEMIANRKMEHYAEQGTQYQYSGVNPFLLAWMLESVSGMPLQDVFTREIWSRIGAESDASYLAPRNGVPLAHGGFMARMRDMARFGLLFTPSYAVVADKKLLPETLFDSIGLPATEPFQIDAREAAGKTSTGTLSRYQWGTAYENGDVYRGGWAGQGLLINRERDLVAVYTGYIREGTVDFMPRLRSVLNAMYGPTDP